MEVCYIKHEYPLGHPRYLGRPKFHNRDNSSSSCAAINSAAQEADSRIPSLISQDNDSNGLGFSLTRAQYQGLLGLFQQQKPNVDASPSMASSQPKHANISQVSKSNSNDSPEMYFGTHFVFCTTITPRSLSNAHTAPITHTINCTPWIIDSGATDHITCSFNNFLSF